MLITNPTKDLLKIESDDKQHIIEVKQLADGFKVLNDGQESGGGGSVVDCHFYKGEGMALTSTYTPSEVEDFMKQGRIVNGYLHSDESSDARFLGSAWMFNSMNVVGEQIQQFIGVVFGFVTVSASGEGLMEVIPELGTNPQDSTKFMLYGG